MLALPVKLRLVRMLIGLPVCPWVMTPISAAAKIARRRMMPDSTPQSRAGVNSTPALTQNKFAAAAQANSPRVLSIRASSAPCPLASARARTLSR